MLALKPNGLVKLVGGLLIGIFLGLNTNLYRNALTLHLPVLQPEGWEHWQMAEWKQQQNVCALIDWKSSFEKCCIGTRQWLVSQCITCTTWYMTIMHIIVCIMVGSWDVAKSYGHRCLALWSASRWSSVVPASARLVRSRTHRQSCCDPRHANLQSARSPLA